MSSVWLSVIGIGADGVGGLSQAARHYIRSAEFVIGAPRHLELTESLVAGERVAWPSPLNDGVALVLARRTRPVAVLASGDPFWFGIGTLLARHVAAGEMRCLPSASAFSLAASRLRWSLQDVVTLSFCGRSLATAIPLLRPGARMIALSAGAATPPHVAALLVERGFPASRVHVLEQLGGEDERHRIATAGAFKLDGIDPLNVVAIEVEGDDGELGLPLTPGLPDPLFDHDGQITKSEIRAVTLAALAPRRGELLWDIGAGSGAIGIEWMLRDHANLSIAIDVDATRLARAAANAQRLGVPGLRTAHGRAPACLVELPVPDAIFLGGGASDPALIPAAWNALRAGGRLVGNAVTVETEGAFHAARAAYGGTMIRLSIDRLDQLGRMHGFRPSMAITQWVVSK